MTNALAELLSDDDRVDMAAARIAATSTPTTPTGSFVTMNSPNASSLRVPDGTSNHPACLAANSPIPTHRNSRNCTRIVNPLSTSATRACLSDRAQRYRCTIIWSAPWLAIVNTVPPTSPAQNVNAFDRVGVKSNRSNLWADSPTRTNSAQPPGSSRRITTPASTAPKM